MGWASRLVLLVGLFALACTPVTRPSTRPAALDLPNDPPIHSLLSDPLSCTDRATIPQVDNAFDARWAADSNSIAVSHIVTIPNARTITGTEEDQRISIVDLAKGSVRDLGRGSKPAWSGSGVYLSYWRGGDDDLRIVRDGRLAGLAPATQPEVRWVGDALYFFHQGEIRVWKDGLSWTAANVIPELEPRYPRDDVYFSADGERFSMTRYFSDGAADRYVGITATGVMDQLPDDGTLFMQWAPVGHELLLRSATTLTLRAENGATQTATLRSLPGPVHGWTADGRLLVGAISPTMPGAFSFDAFAVFGDTAEVAALPNLLGVRTFSPDGYRFMGITRTGLYSTQLEVYRCGALVLAKTGPRADSAARARAAAVAEDPLSVPPGKAHRRRRLRPGRRDHRRRRRGHRERGRLGPGRRTARLRDARRWSRELRLPHLRAARGGRRSRPARAARGAHRDDRHDLRAARALGGEAERPGGGPAQAVNPSPIG